MDMKDLVVTATTSPEEATALAIANGCVGFYTGIPPKWEPLAVEQGWTLPCVLTVNEADEVTSWTPV